MKHRRPARVLPLVALAALVLSTACGDDDRPPERDSGATSMDGATRDAWIPDTGPPDAWLPDAGPPDAWMPDAGTAGCRADGGIECDGDWTGRCTPGCVASECCSPTGGSFACLPRHADGTCPAADLWVDRTRIEGNYNVEWRFFPDGDCAIFEGCVEASGWRRLLRFSTWTPNTGDADLFLGRPSDEPEHFEYSSCHDHFHFNTYARYRVVDSGGTAVADGHKQAFCLIDFYHYPGTDGSGAVYNCSRQGIQHGWQDVYGRGLDCQWVDVTDVPAGDYELEVDVNFEHLILESDYSNNTTSVPVTIPPDDAAVDITAPCSGGEPDGTSRNCGFTRAGSFTCTPGAMVSAGCSSACGAGACTGDPIMRACASMDDPECIGRVAIGSNDDSGCGSGSCGRGGDCCPRVQFACPASGEYVLFWAPYRVGGTATCTAAAM